MSASGRDLMFLVWSYIANMLLVFAALYGLQAGPLEFNALGIWWCLLQFQVGAENLLQAICIVSPQLRGFGFHKFQVHHCYSMDVQKTQGLLT